MLGVSPYLVLISTDSGINRFEGFTLFSGMIVYTILNFRWDAKSASDPLTQATSAQPFWMPRRLGQLLLMRRNLIVDRKGGVMLLVCYAGDLTCLVGKSSINPMSPVFKASPGQTGYFLPPPGARVCGAGLFEAKALQCP